MPTCSALLSSLLLLMVAAATSFTTTNSFATLPSRDISLSPPFGSRTQALVASSTSSSSSTPLHMNKIDEDPSTSLYTPLDRPLLAVVDTISLVIFAAIGKSSHSSVDGSLDLLAVLVTAFPFVSAWLATSPLTGVYSPDDRGNNIFASTAVTIGKGWIVAVPLGIALRGVIKGYVPPVPFMIVTLISTLVILVGVRILFSVVEDFFVEFV
ncbi:hypothetical protein ACHAXR_011380 [Thalassiosira sp. AJA248-18]